jgi:hypothetical protein
LIVYEEGMYYEMYEVKWLMIEEEGMYYELYEVI